MMRRPPSSEIISEPPADLQNRAVVRVIIGVGLALAYGVTLLLQPAPWLLWLSIGGLILGVLTAVGKRWGYLGACLFVTLSLIAALFAIHVTGIVLWGLCAAGLAYARPSVRDAD